MEVSLKDFLLMFIFCAICFITGGAIMAISLCEREQELKLKIAQGTYDCELYHDQVICYEVGE